MAVMNRMSLPRSKAGSTFLVRHILGLLNEVALPSFKGPPTQCGSSIYNNVSNSRRVVPSGVRSTQTRSTRHG